jgi:hypothetical protein
MSQPRMQQQVRRVISFGFKTGGVWLVHLGIFAGLLWLSARMHESPSAHLEQAEPVREDPFPDLPLTDDVPRCSWPSAYVMPYTNAVMTRPVLLSGSSLRRTPEALAARVSGHIFAKCTLTCFGEVRNCRIIKSLPHMNQAAIDMLESRRYVPVQYGGRPVNVDYVFHVRVTPP